MNGRELTWLLLAVFVGCSGNGTITVTIPKAAVEKGVAAYFPVVSDDYVDKPLPVSVTLRDPEVLLEEGRDQIGLRANIDVRKTDAAPELPAAPALKPPPGLPGKTPGGPPSVESGESAEIPAETHGSITIFCGVAYRPEEAAFYITSLTFEDIRLEGLPDTLRQPVTKAVEKALSKCLEGQAVYTLSDADTTSRTAKTVLKSLTVRNGELKAELGL